jgi:hypothetical protein
MSLKRRSGGEVTRITPRKAPFIRQIIVLLNWDFLEFGFWQRDVLSIHCSFHNSCFLPACLFPRREMVCLFGLRLSSIAPLPISAGLSDLRLPRQIASGRRGIDSRNLGIIDLTPQFVLFSHLHKEFPSRRVLFGRFYSVNEAP